MDQRLKWIDIAKAIAIILMVAGHTSIPFFMSNFIWAFHMPLFFIASGWTTDWNKYSFSGFVKRKSHTLLLPFFIYSVLVLIIEMHYGWKTIDGWIVNGWGEGYALWFIPVLFIATIIVKALYAFREVGGGRLFWIVVVLILCLGIDFHYYRISLPWNLSSIPYAVFMIVLGSEFSKLDFKFWRNNKLLLFFVSILIVTIVSHFFRLDMCFNSILPIVPITIGALAGTLMVFMISKLIEKYSKVLTRVFVAIGKETYIILAFSQITIMLLNEHFHLNVAVKYIILVVVLVTLKYAKDGVNRMFKTKLL